jgi:uncharacterized protein YwgA
VATRIDNRKDVLLLLLYSPGCTAEINEPIVGRTRLAKMLFLFSREAMKHFRAGTSITEENFYKFFPWKFGPYSREVFDDLEFFRLRGFIDPKEADEDALPESAAEWQAWLSTSGVDPDDGRVTEFTEQVYELNAKGLAFTSRLYESLSPEQRKLLKAFKRKTTSTPLRALLKYVYENYRDQTTESEIRDQILGP